jgi:diphosphomevalonate decarboxylase
MSGPLLIGPWSVARAQVNIALIKYWGKAAEKHPGERNLPAVPSLSLTLDGLRTDTRARFAPELDGDLASLDGTQLFGAERARVDDVLAAFRAAHEIAAPIVIESRNHVPTAAGLASSASGMAALAVALGGLVGLDPARAEDATTLSELARIGSGSAARSVFGGWVAWDGPAARPLAPADALPVAVVVAVVSKGKKAIGSRDAMNHTARTSPYFEPWVASAVGTFREAEAALAARDIPALFHAMRVSTWRMHASAMGADPPVSYWQPATLGALREVEAMKADGWLVEATMDAGPNVKVFCHESLKDAVVERLTQVPGVAHTLVTGPGSGPSVHSSDQELW